MLDIHYNDFKVPKNSRSAISYRHLLFNQPIIIFMICFFTKWFFRVDIAGFQREILNIIIHYESVFSYLSKLQT